MPDEPTAVAIFVEWLADKVVLSLAAAFVFCVLVHVSDVVNDARQRWKTGRWLRKHARIADRTRT